MKDRSNEFEAELARSMRRVEAPQGFTDRVLAQTMAREAQFPAATRAKVFHMPAPAAAWRWAGAALAASLVVGAVGSWAEMQHRHRQQQEAERQFAVAMEATSHAMEQTRRRLDQAGVRLLDTTND